MAKQKHEMQKKHIDELNQNNDLRVKQYENEIQTNNNAIQTLHGEVANASTLVETLSTSVAEKSIVEDKVKRLQSLNLKLRAIYPNYVKILVSSNTMMIVQLVGKPLPRISKIRNFSI